MDEQSNNQSSSSQTWRVFGALIWVVIGVLALFVLISFYALVIADAWHSKSANPPDVRQWCTDDVPRRVAGPVFASDDTKLVLTIDGTCSVGVYDVGTENMTLLKPPKGMAAYGATMDAQSNTLAFVLARQVDTGIIDYQLATSRMDGTGMQVLTSSDTQKRFPSYSLDGKKIIFEGSERCKDGTSSYCGKDIYEFDVESRKERRISHWNAVQAGPAHLLQGNRRFVASIFDMSTIGDQNVFMVDMDNAAQYQQLPLNTPTSSSPKPLPTGEIAFVSRVNEYEAVKSSSYIYDVFLWNEVGTRRLTLARTYFRDFAVSNSGRSVLLVADPNQHQSQCDMLLWDVSQGVGRKLRCDLNAKELPLLP